MKEMSESLKKLGWSDDLIDTFFELSTKIDKINLESEIVINNIPKTIVNDKNIIIDSSTFLIES